VAIARTAWVAKGRSGHAAPESRLRGPSRLEKKLKKTLVSAIKKHNTEDRPVRLIFQDEARFGRMAKARRCWAPAPCRPVMPNGYERQFTYVYGAVSPDDGKFDWMLAEKMNTENMSKFLKQIRWRHPDDFIVMILDGASSHRAKDLDLPPHMHLEALPPYSPELNPQEHIWDELREKEFPNRVFESMEGVVAQLKSGLKKLSKQPAVIRSITNWPWIKRLNLNAN
jgi:transposase